MDCFSGEHEAVWSVLKHEYQVEEYLALDIKKKNKRLAIDSLKVLQGQKWHHNVLDLDAYGSPWEHWFEVLKTDRHDHVFVFLTIGTTMHGNLTKSALKALGVPLNTPTGMHRQISALSEKYCLTQLHEHDWIVTLAQEALNPGGSARYIGIHLTKRNHEHRNNHRMDRPHV